MAPACRSPLTTTDSVPALTRKTNRDAPTITIASDARKANSTIGLDLSAPMIVVARSRHSSEINPLGSAPTTSATRKMPPMSGIATSILNSESATAWTTITGQFAAATSAPRFNVGLRIWRVTDSQW